MAGPLTSLAGQGQGLVLRSTRRSQALVITAVDRLARNPESDRIRPLGRVWQLQLDLYSAAVGDPGRLLDDSYTQLQRLVALHQEFMHRLLETVDATERGRTVPAAVANVIPLPRRDVRGG